MGLLDRFAKRVADEITKAPALPAGSSTMTESEMRSQGGIAQTQYGYGSSTPLPRNPLLGRVPFAPGIPLTPGALNPLNPNTGRPDPRRFEYLVAQNINVSENRLVPFKVLRAAADQIDIARRCIEVRKAKIVGLDWDIVLSESATERIISESGGNHLKAMQEAREKYAPEIARLRSFWETPDPQNGLSFSDWLAMSLEDIDVLDAWAIWPQQNVKGEIRGLQLLDGATIKPLLDDRGMRPEPDYGPAFQQILYGFPRSEFTATIDAEVADGEFTSDELAYFVRNRRTNSVYGYSPVERALPLLDIYLRRQQWLRAEFTDGVAPKSWIELPETMDIAPENLKAYEAIFNDDLAGQTEQRARMRFLLPGGKLINEAGYSEKFSDMLDNYLITSITGHFGVLPSEIGFSGSGSLGASGLQQGESDNAEAIGILPTARWISQMISALSYRWLGMPRELEFRLAPSERENNEELARRDDIRRKNGAMTLNENRADLGLPLIESAEADMPMVMAGNSVYFFGNEGIITPSSPLDALFSDTEEPTDEPKAEEPEVKQPDELANDEVKKFIRWIRKGDTARPFNFEYLDETYAEVLTKFVETKDLDSARWYAERYLGL